ncbi:UvrB/UvrC motif-containing protein [Sphingomonas sp.]|uniref:UvrB/UvrC motif-containing protein n=1 Tax=Sphingomonas sp. TaxID=28214 RepID=UPI00289A0C76|nr:UvrB/UvrC motif-containing protein [Sphingomonas sp.]
MTSPSIEELRRAMDAAAERLDFEEARALRDRINLLRGGAENTDVDTSGLTRQRPGAMGLGTSQSRPERPAGWVPPTKPDPMTKGRGRRQG